MTRRQSVSSVGQKFTTHSKQPFHCSTGGQCSVDFKKSSAVAEMSDRGYIRHAPKRDGGSVPFRGGRAWCGLGRSVLPCQVASSSIQRLGHNSHEPQIGLEAVPFFLKGSGVPIEHKVAWAEAYFHTKWYLHPSSHLATTNMGRKLWAVPI